MNRRPPSVKCKVYALAYQIDIANLHPPIYLIIQSYNLRRIS